MHFTIIIAAACKLLCFWSIETYSYSYHRSRLASASVQLHNSEGFEELTSKDVIPLLCSIFLANQGAGEAAQEGKCSPGVSNISFVLNFYYCANVAANQCQGLNRKNSLASLLIYIYFFKKHHC